MKRGIGQNLVLHSMINFVYGLYFHKKIDFPQLQCANSGSPTILTMMKHLTSYTDQQQMVPDLIMLRQFYYSCLIDYHSIYREKSTQERKRAFVIISKRRVGLSFRAFMIFPSYTYLILIFSVDISSSVKKGLYCIKITLSSSHMQSIL